MNEVTENVAGRRYAYRSVAEEARSLVFGDRNEAYGHPVEDFTKTAGFWSVYKGVAFTPEDVAMMMVLVKASRQMFKPKRDNVVDGCGYLECLERIVQARAAGVPITDWSRSLEGDRGDRGEPIFSGYLSREENLANNGLVDLETLEAQIPEGVTIRDLVDRWHATNGQEADRHAETLAVCVAEWERIRRSGDEAEPRYHWPSLPLVINGYESREQVNDRRRGCELYPVGVAGYLSAVVDGTIALGDSGLLRRLPCGENIREQIVEPNGMREWIQWAKGQRLSLAAANALRQGRGWAEISASVWNSVEA